MNENDKNELNKAKIPTIFKNSNFINKVGIFGLGWSYNVAEQSLWSDGKRSSIIFRPKIDAKKSKIILDLEAYIRPKHNTQEIEIFLNRIFKKKVIFDEKQRRNKSLTIEIEDSNQDLILVEFYAINPKSPFDLLETVDTRKKSIKIHSLTLK